MLAKTIEDLQRGAYAKTKAKGKGGMYFIQDDKDDTGLYICFRFQNISPKLKKNSVYATYIIY